MVLDQRVLEYEIELRQTVLMQAQQIAQLKQELGKLALELKEMREKRNDREETENRISDLPLPAGITKKP